MGNNSFFKILLFLVVITFFASCDKDYNDIGDTLIGENHFMLKNSTYSVVAYNQKITPIQSDNLPINPFGIYDNPAFGKTTASFATQLTLASVNPTIGANPVIESVVLEVPYFVDASQTKPITAGGNTYVLDSIYGDKSSKIKLSVYESGYYMRDSDPAGGFQAIQKYFTDQNTDFDNLKIGNRLNDDANAAQNDAFFFDPAQHSITTTDAAGKESIAYSAPSMRLKLNTAFFTSKIINAPSGKLATNDVFKNYFRGLYFKVEQSGSDKGSLAMMDFKKGTITISYKEDLVATTGTTRASKTIVINMAGNTVSLQDQSNTNTAYATATSSANTTLGDERLYLKGGEGSMAILDLFGPDIYGSNGITGSPNGVADQLDIIRTQGWLINQASLVFNIDAASMTNSNEPQRIYLWDLNNRRPIIDYADGTSGTNTKNGKVVFGGNINLDASKRGSTYKIGITNHIRNLVKYTDSTNVKLGVAVTENINITSSNKWRTPKTATTIVPAIPNYTVVTPKWPDFAIETPKASVMNPLGTILYGSKSTVPDEKRLKLEIYYTKPN